LVFGDFPSPEGAQYHSPGREPGVHEGTTHTQPFSDPFSDPGTLNSFHLRSAAGARSPPPAGIRRRFMCGHFITISIITGILSPHFTWHSICFVTCTMGNRKRLWEPGIVYSGVIRTVDRQFLLKPNHHPENSLLAMDCPPNALDPANDIIPKPSTINIIGSSVGRALEKYPVQLHWCESNINHLHPGFSLTPDQLDHASRFNQMVHSGIARGVNKCWERQGHLWSSRVRITPCVDDQAAEQQLFYALTNVVKDGLAETVGASPFFSTYRHLAHGKPLQYWWIDYDAYYQAGGKRKKSHRLKDYLQWTEVKPALLPAWEDLPDHRIQTRVRCQVRDIEQSQRDVRKAENRKVFGIPALFNVAPTDRPKNPKESGPQPLCHASTRQARRLFREKWKAFQDAYFQASMDYRQGFFDREFPEGSFRPPLVTIYNASAL
jgi:hypothetical protein